MNGAVEQVTDPCLSDDVLRDFNAGRIQNPALEEIVADHLGSCHKCETRLSVLPADIIVAVLRQPDPLTPLVDSGQLDAAHNSTKSYRSAPGDDTAPGAPVTSATHGADLPVRIDGYFVVRELGSGGFARVFLAKDPDQDRLVAIKVPRPDRLATAKSRQSFLKEARTVAVLDHPNIVPLYDCRELDDGSCIVVMKYIDGQSLADVIQSERLEPRRAAEIVARIADALDAAHQSGIWHRDVKPSNILLDRDGIPYLADFGLALHEDQQQTQARELAGTYAYMSPEQIRGAAGHLDGRSDIWSLGVVFYELLTRRRPYKGSTFEQLSEEIQHRPHRPPSSHDPNISTQLEDICERCLKKSADQRYPTADRLASDLRSYLRPSRRRWVLVLVGLSCTFVAAAFAVVYAYSHWRDGAPVQLPLPGGPVPSILSRKPETVAWQAWDEDNLLDPDEDAERLIMRHQGGYGLVAYDDLVTDNFSAQFVLRIRDWHGGGGCFWALQPDLANFPTHKCLALVARRVANQDQVRFSVSQFELEPAPWDHSQLHVIGPTELAWAEFQLPDKPQLAIVMTVTGGQVTELRANRVELQLDWKAPIPLRGSRRPAKFGFFVDGGEVTIGNASLFPKEPSIDEEDD